MWTTINIHEYDEIKNDIINTNKTVEQIIEKHNITKKEYWKITNIIITSMKNKIIYKHY